MTSMRARVLGDQGRRRDLATIHVAKKQLAMDDDTYRAMLWSIARVKSAGDLDHAGRARVLEHLKACGFKKSKPGAQDPTSRKIRALWLSLKHLGELRDPSEKALVHYVERMTGVKALQWLSSDQASSVIESLKQWEKRVAAARKPAQEARNG